MRFEHDAPTEEVLGGIHVPLPIAPTGHSGRWDTHHAFYPSRDEGLQGWRQRPLRWSRIQLTDYYQHRDYHKLHDRIWLPETDDQYFKLTLLNAARYLPDQAVDMSGGKARKIDLSEGMRRALQDGLGEDSGRRWRIGWYMADYIVRNGVKSIQDTEEVARYVESATEQERWSGAFRVMRKAAEVVLDPVEPMYGQARSHGSIRQPEPTAGRFLMRLFDGRQPDYMPEMDRQLSIA